MVGKPVTRVLHFLLLLVPKVWQAGRLGLLQSPGLCLTAWFWLRAGKGFGSLSERDLNPTVGLMVDAVWSSSTESFFSCVTNYIFFLLHSLYCLITIRWVMGAWVGKGSLGEIELSKYYHHTDPLSLTGRRLSFFFFCLMAKILPQSQRFTKYNKCQWGCDILAWGREKSDLSGKRIKKRRNF